MPRNTQDRQRVSKKQKGEPAYLATIWDLPVSDLKQLIRDLEKREGHKVYSREKIEAYFVEMGVPRKEKLTDKLPPDTESPELPQSDIYVNG